MMATTRNNNSTDLLKLKVLNNYQVWRRKLLQWIRVFPGKRRVANQVLDARDLWQVKNKQGGGECLPLLHYVWRCCFQKVFRMFCLQSLSIYFMKFCMGICQTSAFRFWLDFLSSQRIFLHLKSSISGLSSLNDSRLI